MRVFLGIVFLVDGLQMVFFAYSLDHFPDKVIRGELDMLLLKPVSAQQLFTAQRLQCGFFLNVILAIGWLGWAMAGLPGGFPWLHSLLLLVVVPAGLARNTSRTTCVARASGWPTRRTSSVCSVATRSLRSRQKKR